MPAQPSPVQGKATLSLKRLLPRLKSQFAGYAASHPEDWQAFLTPPGGSTSSACSAFCSPFTGGSTISSTTWKTCSAAWPAPGSTGRPS